MTDIAALLERSCAPIAPTWPLDRFIAVNPFWPRIHKGIQAVSSELRGLSGAELLMPRAWFRNAWGEGRFREKHLRAAIEQSGAGVSLEELKRLLTSEPEEVTPRARFMDVVDEFGDTGHGMTWRDFIVQNTSQFCASYYDEGQAEFTIPVADGLYAAWLRQARHDQAPGILMGLGNYLTHADSLPASAAQMAELALADLRVDEEHREAYLTGLLLDLNGWASWCAYRRWSAALEGRQDADIVELLAIRLAWEWLLLRSHPHLATSVWDGAMRNWKRSEALGCSAREHDWLFQHALELSWQEEASARIALGFHRQRTSLPPDVQAVFCIDVRSEVFRRAFEQQSDRIETRGFAGFFGIPAAYHAAGVRASVPHLPGLLAPRMQVTDASLPAAVSFERQARLQGHTAWKSFTSNGNASFLFVEGVGAFFGGKLLAESLGFGRESPSSLETGLSPKETHLRKPRIAAHADGTILGEQDRCSLAQGILRGMGLLRNFARLILLVGHGSSSRNNPHAAGLDCGACGGQTGEISARAAAALLNDVNVRQDLVATGIVIPEDTRFVPALHNTTTDEIVLFETEDLPEARTPDLARLRTWLAAASDVARTERSRSLGIEAQSAEAIRSNVTSRARDWATVRPEWGLANNAMFVVAPRARTKHASFEGRAFLHDYSFEDDEDGSILELIMTAPMVVTHWINLQYYASTVDNRRYGSGNKVLHNVVGGHLGVFEGNGGDLRIGLPLQSLHDGSRWMHEPLRLSVFIEAPRSSIERVLAKHENVRNLVRNDWLYLFQIDAAHEQIYAYRKGAWCISSASDSQRSNSQQHTKPQEQQRP